LNHKLLLPAWHPQRCELADYPFWFPLAARPAESAIHTIKKISSDEVSILVIEQKLAEALSVSTRACMLEMRSSGLERPQQRFGSKQPSPCGVLGNPGRSRPYPSALTNLMAGLALRHTENQYRKINNEAPITCAKYGLALVTSVSRKLLGS
jgi:hypothetical protein